MVMKVNVLENGKAKMVVEIHNETATFCHVLKEELWNDEATVNAAFKIDHPLVGIPTLLLETNGKKAPEEVMQEAVKRLKKQVSDFRKEVEKAL